MIGAKLIDLLAPQTVGPVTRRPSMTGPAVEVYPLALPDAEGACIPLAPWGECGFHNAHGDLALTVPWSMAGWLRTKLGAALVRGPEAGVSLDGTARVARAWVRLRPGMRATLPLGALGEVGSRRGSWAPKDGNFNDRSRAAGHDRLTRCLTPGGTATVHDLLRIKQDLQESLSLDKHPVALLIGAGCPVAIRVPDGNGGTLPLIPDVAGLTTAVRDGLADDGNFAELLRQFDEDGRDEFTIEDLLSHVRLLRRIVGQGAARGLTGTKLADLELALCSRVVEAVRPELPNLNTAYHDLADWIGGIQRQSSVTLFTTNYDLLLEQALEDRDLPYFDGFIGARRPFFDLRAIEDDIVPARWARLWKLHGSVNWRLRDDGNVVRGAAGLADGEGVLIHPSELKYDQSRRMPYLAMLDRLRGFLRQPSAFLVTVGYSYADEHLNEVVLQGLRSNPRAAAFGLLYKKLEEEPGAHRLATRPPLNLTLLASDRGVVRGNVGPWLAQGTNGDTSDPIHNDLGDFAAFARFLKELCANRSRGAHA